jgi:O-antigen ligase
VILDQWEGLDFIGIPFLTLTKIFFLAGAAILLVRGVAGKVNKQPLMLPAAALAHLPFSLICLGSAVAFSYSLSSSIRWLIAPLTLPFLGIVLTQFVPSRASALRLVKCLAVYSFFPMVMALTESLLNRRLAGGENFVLYGIDDIFRVAGNFENPNDFVVLILFSIPILLVWALSTDRFLHRVLLLGGCLLQFAVLVKTYSRSGYISLAFTLFALVVFGRGRIRKVGLLVCVAGALAFLIIPETRDRLLTLAGIRTQSAGVNQALASLNYRKQLSMVAIWEFLEHPVLGIGYGNIGPRAKTYSMLLYTKNTAENTYLEVLAEMGLAGFAAYLFFLLVAWRALRTQLKRSRGDTQVEPFMVALAAGYAGFAFNSLFDTNIPDNLPWVLLAVMVHLTPQPEHSS